MKLLTCPTVVCITFSQTDISMVSKRERYEGARVQLHLRLFWSSSSLGVLPSFLSLWCCYGLEMVVCVSYAFLMCPVLDCVILLAVSLLHWNNQKDTWDILPSLTCISRNVFHLWRRLYFSVFPVISYRASLLLLTHSSPVSQLPIVKVAAIVSLLHFSSWNDCY